MRSVWIAVAFVGSGHSLESERDTSIVRRMAARRDKGLGSHKALRIIAR